MEKRLEVNLTVPTQLADDRQLAKLISLLLRDFLQARFDVTIDSVKVVI